MSYQILKWPSASWPWTRPLTWWCIATQTPCNMVVWGISHRWSSYWLQMLWHLLGAKASATNMSTYDYLYMGKSPSGLQTHNAAAHFHHTDLLTHCPLMMPYDIRELGQYWYRQWLIASSAPSHYLDQCWLLVNWILSSQLQRNLIHIANIFFVFENVISKLAAILFRPQYANLLANYHESGTSCADFITMDI